MIGLQSIISYNWAGFCLFYRIVRERESSQLSCLFFSAKLPAGLSNSQPSAFSGASPEPKPCELSAVSLLRINPALVSVPIKHFLFSPAFLFGYNLASGFTIGLCPINCENNDCFCLSDWIGPECGSFEFSRDASANLAVLS